MKNRLQKMLTNFFLPKMTIVSESHALRGKIIVITGGSKGVGNAIAEVLQVKGAVCIRIARSFTENTNTSVDTLSTIKADITKKQDVDRAINEIINKYGRIDVLINNAGIFLSGLLEKSNETDFDTIVHTNMKGMYLTSQAVLPLMKKQKAGLIINVGSKISHNTRVEPKKVLYAMTKYAVEGFSFALNREVKPFGIRVTCIMPGTINTFVSRNANKFLSPFEVGKIVSMIIENEDIDFENILFKSIRQDI